LVVRSGEVAGERVVIIGGLAGPGTFWGTAGERLTKGVAFGIRGFGFGFEGLGRRKRVGRK